MLENDFKETTRKTIGCEEYKVMEIGAFPLDQLEEKACSKSIIKSLTKNLRLVIQGQELVGGGDTKTR